LSIPDKEGYLKCSCGCTTLVTDLEPSLLYRAKRRLATSLFSGFVAIWFPIGIFLRLSRDVDTWKSYFLWGLALACAAFFVIGAILGERLLNPLMDSIAAHDDSSRR
jgi:hypothetical protein